MNSFGRILIALVPLAGLAACATDGAEDKLRADAITPTEQYSIAVSTRPEQIALKVHPGGLSPAQETALADLAARWRDQGSGDLTIETPTGGDPALARVMADQSRVALMSMGVPPERIELAGYNNAPDQPLAVRVGYLVHQAAGPDCGRDWDAFTKTGSNRPYKQFGCSV
ncbi:MAG: CpaD family pilus assembly lipoprotein, partial [Caulobacteraceae bacterium]